jgi:predicted transcriptional regulator
MSFADDEKRKKERPSYSSPDRLRQDTIEEGEKQTAKGETKEKLSKLQRDNLLLEIESAHEKSTPVQEKQKGIAQAHERDRDAKQSLEKTQEREKDRQAAMEQGGPETQSGIIG